MALSPAVSKRIANFAEAVVPFMAFACIGLALIIIVTNIVQVPGLMP